MNARRWEWPEAGLIVAAALLLALLPATAGAKIKMKQGEMEQGKKVLTSRAVVGAVENELTRDEAVPANRIDVASAGGVVTLTGTVGNILAKERAARIAETVKGVRSVVNRIEVKPPVPRSDVALREAVSSALLWDPVTGSYDVHADVKEGVATLSGTVHSRPEKKLAGRVVKGIEGVRSVHNELKIDYQAARTDKAIRKDIVAALKWDRWIDDAMIGVGVKSGKVALTGTVGSAAEKSRAARKAWVNGVRSVDVSDLKVSRWARDADLREDKYGSKPDGQVRAAVERTLIYDPRVDAAGVKTDVTGGVATLSGEVDNLRAKRAAVQDATNTVGVHEVHNRVRVRLSRDLRRNLHEEEVAAAVRGAFARDPFVERENIRVRVRDGVARLSGSVNSYFEKSRAEDLAAGTQGVEEVRNRLKVDGVYRRIVPDPYVNQGTSSYGDQGGEHPMTAHRDQVIEKSIESELFWSPFVDADEVKVSVDHGVATLTGTVDTRSERRAAVENAYEGGAVRVKNRLSVKGGAG